MWEASSGDLWPRLCGGAGERGVSRQTGEILNILIKRRKWFYPDWFFGGCPRRNLWSQSSKDLSPCHKANSEAWAQRRMYSCSARKLQSKIHKPYRGVETTENWVVSGREGISGRNDWGKNWCLETCLCLCMYLKYLKVFWKSWWHSDHIENQHWISVNNAPSNLSGVSIFN